MSKLFDQILFDVNVDMIEGDVEKFSYCLDRTTETDVPEDFCHMLYAVLANAKATEEDDDISVPTMGTRRPGNRADRRKANKATKRRLSAIEPFTMSVRPAGKSGYVRCGNGEFHKLCKRMDNRISRHEGKADCRSYVPDTSEVPNIWDYTDEEVNFLEFGGHLHGDFTNEDLEKIVADWNKAKERGDYSDYDLWDEYNDCPYEDEPGVDDLQKEIETYKEFINTFNLNTLFQHWKANK